MPTLKEVVSAKTIDKALTKYKSAAQHQLSGDAKDYAELLEILVDFFGETSSKNNSDFSNFVKYIDRHLERRKGGVKSKEDVPLASPEDVKELPPPIKGKESEVSPGYEKQHATAKRLGLPDVPPPKTRDISGDEFKLKEPEEPLVWWDKDKKDVKKTSTATKPATSKSSVPPLPTKKKEDEEELTPLPAMKKLAQAKRLVR